jgi:hypothetical protein
MIIFLHLTDFERFKFWITKNYKDKLVFKILDGFKLKSYEYQNSLTSQDLHFVLWPFLHLTHFEWFKFWISKIYKDKLFFKILDGFQLKSHEYQVCLTSQDLHIVLWSFLHLTDFEWFKFWISKNLHGEIKFWNPVWCHFIFVFYLMQQEKQLRWA